MVANDKTCIIISSNNLFTQFLKTNNQSLFANHIKTFSKNYIIKKPQEKVCILWYKKNYTDYLFKKRATMSA